MIAVEGFGVRSFIVRFNKKMERYRYFSIWSQRVQQSLQLGMIAVAGSHFLFCILIKKQSIIGTDKIGAFFLYTLTQKKRGRNCFAY